MTPQQVAEPADEPQAALTATCRCRRRIWRLALDSARWRHDNGAVTCPPTDPAFEHHVKGEPGVTCTEIAEGGFICREEMREVSRERDGDERWCFVERKHRTFELVVTAPVGLSYYGPNPSIQCASCGTTDADLFPGRVREWEG